MLLPEGHRLLSTTHIPPLGESFQDRCINTECTHEILFPLPAATELTESCSIRWQKAKYTAVKIVIIIIIDNTIGRTRDTREGSGRFHKIVGSLKTQVAGPGP